MAEWVARSAGGWPWAAYHASSTTPIELTASVEAGLTYQVDVVAISGSVREFELSTTLR
jgi:hypothetical protein